MVGGGGEHDVCLPRVLQRLLSPGVMRTGGHGRDDGEPLGVDHQVRVIDVGVVNKQGAERPSSGGWRIYKFMGLCPFHSF